MSKSLKNFVTIRELLQQHSPQQLRMFCLQHHYRATVEFSDDRMRDASLALARFSELFSEIDRVIQMLDAKGFRTEEKRWSDEERSFMEQQLESQRVIRQRFARDFDTPGALAVMGELVTRSFAYINGGGSRRELLSTTRGYLHRMLHLLGLDIGSSAAETARGGDEMMETLVRFRTRVREMALLDVKAANSQLAKDLLRACDELRDKDLVEAGFLLKDRAEGAVWRPLAAGEADLLKADNELSTAPPVAPVAGTSASSPPHLLFRNSVDESGELLYSAFDEAGVPTHHTDGEALSKALRKKLAKKMDKAVAKWKK